MKKLISLVIGIGIIVLIGYLVYHFFIDCEKFNSEFDKRFTMSEMDQVTIEDEVIIKLLSIEDNTYQHEDGTTSGEYEFKVLVLHDDDIAYVTMGSFSNPEIQPGKLKYRLKFVELKDEDEATFIISRMKE